MKPENENKKTIFCKKVRFGSVQSPSILLGIIINDIDGFIEFKTANNKIMISKNSIISIEDTKEIFRGDSNDEWKRRDMWY